MTDFSNVYDDRARARAYADLAFPGTYHLAFRDLPRLIERHVAGRGALDFGCGAGRSTRFLRGLGFDVVGVDISEPMLEEARARDPGASYLRVDEGSLARLGERRFDLVFSAFTFDNVRADDRLPLFEAFRRLLSDRGRVVNLVSAPDIYVNEWTSFSTRDFPENRSATVGDTVRIVMLDVDDRRPVEDIYWTDEAYRDLYRLAGLKLMETHRPLGRPDEPYEWVSETRVSPWSIYVLGPENS